MALLGKSIEGFCLLETGVSCSFTGEMHYLPMGPDSIVSLPRDGGVAYHAQESWVLNETIRVSVDSYVNSHLHHIFYRTTFSSDRFTTKGGTRKVTAHPHA